MKTITILSTMLILFSVGVNAQIRHVPAEYPTIQSAINASVRGDTVLVSEGWYFENIDFKGKAITVASHYLINENSDLIKNTIIDGSQTTRTDTGSVVRFVSGEDTTSVLFGFTIQNGTGTTNTIWGGSRIGGGILCFNSGAKIINNAINNNSLTHVNSAGGAGIVHYDESGKHWMVVENNTISYNTTKTTGRSDWINASGGGIYGNSNARIRNNEIQYNECYSSNSASGAGVEFHSTEPKTPVKVSLFDNNISHNKATGGELSFGGGVSNFYVQMYLRGNTISDNSLVGATYSFGAGINIYGWENYGAEVVIEKNNFSSNNCQAADMTWGSAINLSNPDHKVSIRNNLFSSNTATANVESNGAVTVWFYTDSYVGKNSEIVFDGNIFMDNSAKYGAAISAYNSFNFSITNNFFLRNKAQVGGAIYLKQFSLKSGDLISSTESTRSAITNNSFVYNVASTSGGAITNEYSTETAVTFNNLYWQNYAPEGEDIKTMSNVPMFIAYSLIDENKIHGKWTGNGNFTGTPGITDDSLHIDNSSLCLDKGINSIVYEDFTFNSPAYDFDGDERPAGNSIDVGADELLAVGIFSSSIASESFIEVYPNPFRNHANIKFHLDEPSACIIEIFNTYGEKVESIVPQKLGKGTHKITWKAVGLPDGIYHLRMKAGGKISTAKILHLN